MKEQNIPEAGGDGEPFAESILDLIDLRLERTKAQILDHVHHVDRQIADLQIDAVQAKKPWYRDASVIISIAVFLFSLSTTLFTQRQVEEQQRQSDRAELRGLIQRLSEIPREKIEYDREFTDAGARAHLEGLLQAENAMIARQAAEIMDRLPGGVSASEYSLVGYAMVNSNLGDEAVAVFERAIETADNSNDKVAALRGKAALLMAAGDLEGGRAAFGQALRIFEEFPTRNGFYEHLTHLDTHMVWAGAEFTQGQCGEAVAHLEQARQQTGWLVPGPVAAQKLQQIADGTAMAASCVPRPAAARGQKASMPPGQAPLAP